jgi:xylono-1,5-lactonase
MLTAEPEAPACVAVCQAVLGEGPVWVEREQALYWVDIKGDRIFRRRFSDGEVTTFTPPLRICSLAPRASGGFIAGSARGFALVDLDAGRYELIGEVEPDLPQNRFNDGKVDRQGRFWAGTMDGAEKEVSGALYRLDPDRSWSRVDDGYRVTNGPAFSIDGKRMYHSDSARRRIYVFDLNEGGGATGKRLFTKLDEQHGYPDGMTVDADDCLWVAFWDGWCVRRFSPAGECIKTIQMPVQRPTSCAFGGPELDHLFITSACGGLNEKALSTQPYAGGLFMIKPGVRGAADALFAG